jgi:hypothetical protein
MLFAGNPEYMLVLIMQKSNIADNQQTIICKLSWLAGIIDGEGGIGFKTNTGKSKTVVPVVRISNTDFVMIDYICGILNQYELEYFIESRKGKKNDKDSQSVNFIGCTKCIPILELIQPFLVAKSDIAKLLLAYAQKRKNARRPLSDEEKDLCRKVYGLIGRGTIPIFDR